MRDENDAVSLKLEARAGRLQQRGLLIDCPQEDDDSAPIQAEPQHELDAMNEPNLVRKTMRWV